MALSTVPENALKRKGYFVFISLLCLAGVAPTQAVQPVTATQLMAWLAGGVPQARLRRIIQERGYQNAPTLRQIQEFQSAGADEKLIRALPASAHSATGAISTEIPASLLKTAVDAQASTRLNSICARH
jgi:hypothetical protein